MVNGNFEAFQNVFPSFSFFEFKLAAAGHDILPVLNKLGKNHL